MRSGSSLDSSDVFILETPSKTWVWSGQGSVEEETEQAVRLSGVVSPGREMVMVKEGEEEDEFWEALGGKTEYNNSDDINKPILHPRSLLKNTILRFDNNFEGCSMLLLVHPAALEPLKYLTSNSQ